MRKLQEAGNRKVDFSLILFGVSHPHKGHHRPLRSKDHGEHVTREWDGSPFQGLNSFTEGLLTRMFKTFLNYCRYKWSFAKTKAHFLMRLQVAGAFAVVNWMEMEILPCEP
jgi:hypothetical protein